MLKDSILTNGMLFLDTNLESNFLIFHRTNIFQRLNGPGFNQQKKIVQYLCESCASGERTPKPFELYETRLNLAKTQSISANVVYYRNVTKT